MSYHYLCSQLINTHSAKKATWDCQCGSSIGDCSSLNEKQTELKGRSKGSPPFRNCLITSTLMTVSGVGGRNLVNARIKQITLLTPHLNAAQCVRVIQTRKVRTGQNTSIYHRMNGINGYEFELLFKWVTKLYLWERRVLRIGFTSVKPKPSLLRETLKKLIIPIGPNIVFSWDLDKAWIIIDTQSWSSLLTTPALIASWFREPLQYGHLIAMLWFRP